MNKIPLHCIVVLIGPLQCGKTTWAINHFQKHEIISATDIRAELCGDHNNHTMNHYVWDELYRRTELKISLGQRVVIDATNLKSRDRKGFYDISEKYGVELIYVNPILNPLSNRLGSDFISREDIEKSNNVYLNSLHEIQSGDNGKAQVYGIDSDIVHHPQNGKLPDNILVIGDVHGNYDAMLRAVETAANKNLFIVWLGDVIDYGQFNLKCMKLAYDTIRNGNAMMILGNHERKLDRWISNNWGATYHGKLSDSNKLTVNEILGLSEQGRIKFSAAWAALNSWCFQHIVSDEYLFTHGAASVNMWTNINRRLYGVDANLAYFGQVDNIVKKEDGYPNRIWDWVNDVPAGKTVVVGHDWLDRVNNEITIKTNDHGGRVVAIDCGCSKGGRLCGVIIDLKTSFIDPLYFDG